MDKRPLIVISFASLLAFAACKGQNFSADGLQSGALSMVKAATLSNEEVAAKSLATAQQIDSESQVAPAGSPYDARLQNLARYIIIPGYNFNFKVYMSQELNAFALPSGDVRVNSALMDAMNDQELLFVIGHEVGHVVRQHSTDQFKLAYAASGLRDVAASSSGTAGQIASSDLGGLAEKFVNAQFSQTQEEDADDYGVLLLKSNNLSPAIGAAALRKLASAGSNPSLTQKLFSSHPEPEARAKRIEQRG
ncbi:MAG: M48 family metalloprotease [Rickettsiales bacterium]